MTYSTPFHPLHCPDSRPHPTLSVDARPHSPPLPTHVLTILVFEPSQVHVVLLLHGLFGN